MRSVTVTASETNARAAETPTLTIGELARRTGLPESAIRYYERIGLLPEPERERGWRRYDGSAVRLLSAIRFAKQAGFSLEEIRTLFHGFPPGTPPPMRWQQLATRKLAEVEELIARAETMRSVLREGLDCDCALRDCRGLEDCELGSPASARRKAS